MRTMSMSWHHHLTALVAWSLLTAVVDGLRPIPMSMLRNVPSSSSPPPPPPATAVPPSPPSSSLLPPELEALLPKNLPTVTMPDLPRVTMPDLPTVTMPDLPRVTMPDLPTVTMPDLPGVSMDLLPSDVQASVAELVAAFSHVDPSEAPVLLAPLVVAAGAAMGQAWARVGSLEAGDLPYSAGDSGAGGGSAATGYSDAAAAEFFAARPLVVLKRLMQLTQLTGVFNFQLLVDYLATPRLPASEGGAKRTPWNNEPARARDALVLANQMGPTFIKLGQALSIRTDLISEAYALELRQLQDAVPPFDSIEAYAVLRRELGVKDLSSVFKTISAEPVASASIGQVYRGTLLDGRDVAVKVQRPSVLADIALDLYILRLLMPIQVRVSNAINKIPTEPEDIDVALQLVDEWGRGFVAEVDYLAEARNTMEFSAAMERRGLNAVTAPTVVTELSTGKVLVTEWVEGTRLDRDASDDVPRLCGVAINAYLTMLLDTGTLHCDPHPGNLLRTTDGRLCVLDWGMTLAVPNDLQYALLEFIAHVNSGDFDAIPADFVGLGFTPPDKLERVKNSGITEGLTFALRQLSAGGGPSKIRERVKEEFLQRYGPDLTDEELRTRARAEMVKSMEEQLASEGVDVNGVTNVMEEMSRRNRELFKLPPYVLYVSRAFSTLEGIGLSIDEDYAILQECYPYLARRLFTDNSPRARAALRAMLYGPPSQQLASGQAASPGLLAARQAAGGGGEGGLLSPEKLVEMTDGFTSYTAATADADTSKGLEEAGTALAELLLASAEENRANARLATSFEGAETSPQPSGTAVLSSPDPFVDSVNSLAMNKNAIINKNDPYGYGYNELAETAPVASTITEDGEEIFEYGAALSSAAATSPASLPVPSAEEEASDLNLVQELVVDEAAKFVDAAVRSQLKPLERLLSERGTTAAAAASSSSSPSSSSSSSPAAASSALPSPAALLFGAPLAASKRLHSALNTALPEPLRPLVAPLQVPSQLAAAAAPLIALSPDDEAVFATAEALAGVLQTATGANPRASSGDASADAAMDVSTGVTADVAATAATAQESLRSATETARQALELLTTDDEKVAGLRAKVPGAASALSRRFAARLLSRGLDRLEGATAAQLSTGELHEGDLAITARRNVADAAKQVVSALEAR